ncbi:EIN3-binding F-box protein 1-like [Nymphaea colorata]|nr:EIN3-binding F-box protein 1-like [Nymphaea colorata]
MPTLVKYSGDESICASSPFQPNFFDSGLMFSSPRVDVYCPQRKRARISAPFVLREQEQLPVKIVPSIDILPDECLFEIFSRVAGIRDRSACACVSKRWLTLQSSIRRSEIVSLPRNCSPVNPTKETPATNKDAGFPKETLEKESPETIEVDGDDAEEVIGSDDGYLSRSLEGKKATDIRLAAISIGTANLGGLGKLLIRGSNATRGVTDVGLTAIARGCPGIKVLSIWNVSAITDKSLCEISEGCHQLEKLDISHCPGITDKGLLAIAERCRNLSSLTLESCPLVGNSCLQAFGRSCVNLQSISIKDCPLVGDQGVAGLVALAANLAKIKLQGVNVSDVSLAVIGHYGKSVTELSFRGLQNAGERGFWALGNARGLRKLKTLTVSSCKGITDVGLEAVGVGCPLLKNLSLRRCCFLSDNGLRAFARVAQVLENLQLEECNRITQIGILTSFAHCKAKLKTLSLIKCMGIKDQNVCLNPLPFCNSLRTLTIQGCAGFGDQGLAAVGKICPRLQQVAFSGLTGITDMGFFSFIESCEGELVKVNLNGCENLTDNAVTRLVMHHGGSLQVLNLGGCRRVTDVSLKALLMNCPLLQDLDMSRCSITDRGIVSLRSSTKELPDLLILSLSGCSQVSDISLPVLGNLSGSLVGLNLQHCNAISNTAVGWLGERMWRCDILS